MRQNETYSTPLLYCSCNFVGEGLQFLRFHLDMMPKVQIARLVQWHEVNVDMRHIDTDHRFANLNTRTYFFQSFGNTASKEMQLGKEFFIEVEYVVNLFLRNAENMPTNDRIDVEESKAMLGFCDFIARNFTGNYLAEYRCHS